MKLLGERNWYLPAWLEWLPRLSWEGETVVEPDATPARRSPRRGGGVTEREPVSA